MISQEMNETRPFRVAIIYMVEKRTRERIRGLCEQLRACGIDVFIFSDDMTLVESHAAEMQKQIANVDAVIICYSENFEQGVRGYRHQEVRIALEEQRKRPPENAYLITINLDECPVPPYLSEARVPNYFRKEHFDGIMRWGLVIRREQLIKAGEKIQEFNYQLLQPGPKAEEPISQRVASAQRSALPNIWNIPYPRNPFFTGRSDLLLRLHSQLQAGEIAAHSQPQAVSGLGGVGKTHLAIEYAYRYRQEYEVVLWAPASSQEALVASYGTIATLLKLPERAASGQEAIMQAVKRWLQKQSKWLLILDNADNLDLLLDFLPPVHGGHILITTRAWDMQRLASRVEVETLPDEQGALFLLRRAALVTPDTELSQVPIEDQKIALQIAQELGGLPLALDQAGAYLEATGMSLSQYCQVYHQHRQALLAERRAWRSDHPEPVATTWSLSFEKVEAQNKASAELLRLCAYLAPDAIPETIITQGASHLGSLLAKVSEHPFLLGQAVEVLRAYSLIQRDPRTQTLSVHRLVQAVLHDSMEKEAEKEWKRRAVMAVNAACPNVEDVTQWNACERWLPHALVCALWMEQEQMISPETASMLNTAGGYLSIRTRYREAESLYHRALTIREQLLGPEHPDTANSLHSLGVLYYSQDGGYALAEFFHRRALAIREQKLGPEHPDTAQSLNSLGILYSRSHPGNTNPGVRAVMASLYWVQTKLPLAESLYQRALARFYPDQNKFVQAESLHQRALAIREQKLGPEHPDTAESLDNLAFHYWNQGKFALVEPLYQRALVIYEQKLGPEHPRTAACLIHLALFYHSQIKWNNYRKAVVFYQRGLTISEQNLGTGHPITWFPLIYLYLLQLQKYNFEEAEATLRRVLAIAEQVDGPEDPDTKKLHKSYTFIQKLAYIMGIGRKIREKLLGRSQSAEVGLFSQPVLALNDHLEELKGLDTAQSLYALAFRYWDQGKYVEAEAFHQHALAVNEQQLGPEHPDTVKSLDYLAFVYEMQGKYKEAESLYQRVLVVNEQQLGLEHPDTVNSLDNLAQLYRLQGDYARAVANYDQVLLLDSKRALAYNGRGYAYRNQGDYARAIADYTEAILLDPRNAVFYNNRGRAYYAQGDYAHAIGDYTQAIFLDPKNATIYFNRGDAYERQNNFAHAIADFDQAILLDPKNARVYNARGYAYYFQNDSVQAIADFDQAILLDPKYLDAYYGRSCAYNNLGDYVQAIADLDQVLLLDLKNVIAYNDRGYVYYTQCNYPRAIADYDQAILLNPKNADIYNLRGLAYSAQEDYVRAIADYDQALLLNPKDAAFHVNRGNAYNRQKDYTHAIVDFEQAILLDPKYARAYNGRGNAYRDQSDYPHAIADYNQALLLDPKDAIMYSNRGQAYSLQNDYTRAIADLDQALLLDPKCVSSYYRRGHIYSAQHDYARAIADYRQAILLDPDDAPVHRRRGRSHPAQQDHIQILAALDQALLLDPNDATAYRLRQMFIDKFGPIANFDESEQ